MHSEKIFYSQIEQATCAHFRIARADLQSQEKKRELFYPRAIVVALARHHTRLSYPQLGAKLHRDHTTMLSAIRRAKVLLAENENFRADFVAVEKLLVEGPPPDPQPAGDSSAREEAMARAWRDSLPKIPYRLSSNLESAQ